MTGYVDLDLLFYTGAGGEPHVRAAGTEGQAHAPVRLPADVFAEAPDPPAPDALGDRLYHALFQGDVGALLAASRAARPDGTVLRIRLQYDLNDERARALAALPWELMREPRTDTPLVLVRDLTLVRHVDLLQTTRVPAFTPPLNILFAMSNPLGDLDLEGERRRIEARLASHGHEIHGEFVTIDSLTDLEDRLRAGEYHVVHFMGHGDFVDGEGTLLIGDHLYDADHIAPVLARSRQTRLVVLNACDTATIAAAGGRNPFAGLAVALLRKGVPAVVAMQYEIDDEAAALFAERLYSEIARRCPLEEAVDAARVRLWAEFGDPLFCATPVLFLRGRGDLFAQPAVEARAEVPTLATFMLDRLEVIERLAAALRARPRDSGAPLVAIAHGPHEACFDTLVDRLQRRELPRYLRLDDRRQSVRKYRFDLPASYGERRELHEFLTFSIARKVADHGTATLDDVRRHLAALSAPPLVYGMMSAETWRATGGRRCLDDFRAYWSDWPAAAGRPAAIVVLGIAYGDTEPERRGLLRWFSRPAPSVNDEIEAVLDELASGSTDGSVLVLPRLGEISHDHALSWALEIDRRDLVPEIRRIFEQHRRTTGSATMSMERASDELEKLLASESPAYLGAA